MMPYGLKAIFKMIGERVGKTEYHEIPVTAAFEPML